MPRCHRVKWNAQHAGAKSHTPPSTWTLFRLWRFAKPYKWRLLAGFLLTLGSTAADAGPALHDHAADG